MYIGLMAFAFGILEDLVKESDFFNYVSFCSAFLVNEVLYRYNSSFSLNFLGSDSAAVIYPLTLLEQLSSPPLGSCT
ncbi:hypothetical protein BT93_F0171 [Corymbia citriodora subsp. variegata]|nr:hypothetical protein BT93_F0171 [Corymbia citriodora subsp. variegata]